MIWVFMSYFTYGGLYAMMPALSVKIIGKRFGT